MSRWLIILNDSWSVIIILNSPVWFELFSFFFFPVYCRIGKILFYKKSVRPSAIKTKLDLRRDWLYWTCTYCTVCVWFRPSAESEICGSLRDTRNGLINFPAKIKTNDRVSDNFYGSISSWSQLTLMGQKKGIVSCNSSIDKLAGDGIRWQGHLMN